MSERPPTLLTLSTLNLSADGTRILRDEDQRTAEVTEAAALAVLTAFAALPAMEVADADAKIYLAGPRGKVAVQNISGKLFVTSVPETVNTPVQRTPEETIALLTADAPVKVSAAVTAEAARDAEIIAEVSRHPRGWGERLNSVWTLVALLIVAAIVVFFSFPSETIDGVDMIHDGARISRLNAEFNGRYGAPGATALVLVDGNLKGFQPVAGGAAEDQLFELGYRFGLREHHVVLLVENGTLLEPQPDGAMKYLESTYPRQRP